MANGCAAFSLRARGDVGRDDPQDHAAGRGKPGVGNRDLLCRQFFAGRIGGYLEGWISDQSWQKALIWGGALLVSLPFLIAAYRKLKALSMLLAEMSVKPEMAGRHTQRVRRVIAELIPILSLLVIFLLLAALSASILPTNKLLVLIAVVTAAVAAVLWRWFIRVHTRMQVALLETLDNHKDTQ